MKIITAYAMPLSPALLLAAIAETNVVCAMSKAQHVSWQIALSMLLAKPSEERDETQSLFGVPLTIDESLDPSTIEIRQNGNVLVRLENLAIPMSMCA